LGTGGTRPHTHPPPPRANGEGPAAWGATAARLLRRRRRADLGGITAERDGGAPVPRVPRCGPQDRQHGANILVRQFKIPLRDYYFVDISVDVQVRRVMTRLSFVPEGTSDELLIYAAREAHPEFPGIFDLALWRIGKDVCTQTAPHCGTCPLAKFCAYAAARRTATPQR